MGRTILRVRRVARIANVGREVIFALIILKVRPAGLRVLRIRHVAKAIDALELQTIPNCFICPSNAFVGIIPAVDALSYRSDWIVSTISVKFWGCVWTSVTS